eukprot:COSAG02_NODE_286_length_25649_cov_13.411272_13_plen_30_part_00
MSFLDPAVAAVVLLLLCAAFANAESERLN